MNDLLDQVWLDNTVRDYLIILAVILFAWMLNRFISHYFAGLIFRIVKKVWKGIEKKYFINLVVQPLGIFFVVLVAIISLHRLSYPQVLEFEVYRFTLKQFIYAISTVILISVFTWLLLRMIDFIAMVLEQKADLTPEHTDNQLIVFFKDFFKVILIVIGLMLILRYAFNLNISSLITGLSIVGAAIALALRESIENLIASFIIFFDKPFTTGDLIKVVNITGTVEKIGLRSTRIRSDQKTLVTVPNKQMVDTVLDNLSLRSQRKVELKLEINLNTPSAKIESLIEGIKKIVTNKNIEDSNVSMPDITGKFFLIQADYFTAPVTLKEFNSIKQQVNLETLKLMEALQIEIAGANADLRISNNKLSSEQS